VATTLSRGVDQRENSLNHAIRGDPERSERDRPEQSFGSSAAVAAENHECRAGSDDGSDNSHDQRGLQGWWRARVYSWSFEWSVGHFLSCEWQGTALGPSARNDFILRAAGMDATFQPMNSPDERFSYDSIAAEYAAKVESAPFNALYERPAMLALLPDLTGRRILDAGCGPGWYARELLARGATVDGIDASAAMIAYARERLSGLPAGEAGRITLRLADLEQPLDFEDNQFDGIVSPLVLHYLADWRPTLREFHRVLKPGGWLQFSTHHPAADATLFNTRDYFCVERVTDHWDWVGKVTFFRRSLSEIFDSLGDTGFTVEKVKEPAPLEDFRSVNADAYDRLMNQPAFIIFVARAR
jgi:SAM-dependent methyltransferase